MSPLLKRHHALRQTPDQIALLSAIRTTKDELDCARYFFNTECSAELVSSTVYQINSLQEKYSYLLGEAKKNNVVAR